MQPDGVVTVHVETTQHAPVQGLTAQVVPTPRKEPVQPAVVVTVQVAPTQHAPPQGLTVHVLP